MQESLFYTIPSAAIATLALLSVGCSDDTGESSSSTGGATSSAGGGTSVSDGLGGNSASAVGGANNGTSTSATGGNGSTTVPSDPFSFFVTSFEGMQRLSGSQDGFGGDLRFGEADGLTGADKICAQLAEASLPGAGAKQWRAFLSAAQGPDGSQVNAIDRIGEGPWYDRMGRVFAMNKAALLNARPEGADSLIVNDFPNEYGAPNHDPDGTGEVDNHHFLTGSDENGTLYASDAHCNNWTSTSSDAGRPRIGFSWPAGNRQHWISGQTEGGCGAGAVLVDSGGSSASNPIVGSGGGYGGIYCFALTP